MGQVESNSLHKHKITRNLFEFKYVIGRGGFGKVWKVAFKKTGSLCALKEMSKVKIIDRKSEKSIFSERMLLSKLQHPFLVNMIYAFQDTDYLYLAMDLLNGGDLRYHICKHHRFNEEQTKFFMACIILGLEYIHEKHVIHRDIKPENLVFDDNGYIRITDFGVAKKIKKENKDETSGTPGYMSPEVLCAQNHGFPADYFALGVMGYEFMIGTRPYWGRSRKEIKQAVLAKQVQIKGHEIPIGWSFEAADLINRLIQRKVNSRIGWNGIEEIKTHPWFSNFDWNAWMEKRMKSPFLPKKTDNFDKKYCEGEEELGTETLERYQDYKRSDYYWEAFNKYTCNNIPEEELKKLRSSSISTSLSTIDSLKRVSSNNSKILKINKLSKLNLDSLNINGKIKLNLGNTTLNKDSNANSIIINDFENKSNISITRKINGIISPSSKNLKIKNTHEETDLPKIDKFSKLKKSSSALSMLNMGNTGHLTNNTNKNSSSKEIVYSPNFRNKKQVLFHKNSWLIHQEKKSLNSVISNKKYSYNKIVCGNPNGLKGVQRSGSTLSLVRTPINILSKI